MGTKKYQTYPCSRVFYVRFADHTRWTDGGEVFNRVDIVYTDEDYSRYRDSCLLEFALLGAPIETL